MRIDNELRTDAIKKVNDENWKQFRMVITALKPHKYPNGYQTYEQAR